MAIWKRKELHGRYINIIDQSCINKQVSLGWLTHGNLFPEKKDSYVLFRIKSSSQDPTKAKTLSTLSIMWTVVYLERSMRRSNILGTVVAARDYTNLHNNVARIIYRELCLQHGLVSNSVKNWEIDTASRRCKRRQEDKTKYSSSQPDKKVHLEMQKATILGTCIIVRKTLNMDNGSQRI